jgi:hypothetical protein
MESHGCASKATLRAENGSLRKLLSEREKVVALLEQRPINHVPFWQRWFRQKEGEATSE